ncbi:MAG: hypothetical protein P8N02_10075 [Actinomycetota bacterium]|nr:hypothetical protein [Actinomycetota bacterium]
MAVDSLPESVMRRGEVSRAMIISLLLAGLVLWPIVRRPLPDSFPHSTYPMFSENREPVADIELALGQDIDGADISLSPELIAGTEEVIVAGSLIRTTVRSGEARVVDLCHSIAARIADTDRSDIARPDIAAPQIVEVVIRTDRLDAVAWFAGDRTPLSSTVHGSCEVTR